MPVEGYGKVSSRIGKKLYAAARIHDDGQYESGGGGKVSVSAGMPGSGKSTLLTQFAENTLYMRSGSKEKLCNAIASAEPGDVVDYSNCILETIIWRIRDADNWPVFCDWRKQLKAKGWNKQKYKKLHLFIHEDDVDTIVFYCVNREHQISSIADMPKIETYSDAKNLVKQLHQNDINAILEPQTYSLSPYLTQKLKEKNLQGYNNGDAEARERKMSKQFDKIECTPAIFWFDFLMELNRENLNRHVTVIIDEFDDVSPARSSGVIWHLTDILSDQFIDMRKHNISAHFSVHALDFVDWRILRRSNYFLWYPGSCPSSAYSMIKWHSLTATQPIGSFIIEAEKIEFGRMTFSKLPVILPAARIEGLKGTVPALDKKQFRYYKAEMDYA